MVKYIIVQACDLADLEEKINGYARDKWYLSYAHDVTWHPNGKICAVIMEKQIWLPLKKTEG